VLRVRVLIDSPGNDKTDDDEFVKADLEMDKTKEIQLKKMLIMNQNQELQV